jgi:predicted nucleic acid-binding protein
MGRAEVFVDTSGLYALVDKKDAHHGAARDVTVALAREGRRLVLSDLVLAEAATLAKVRSGAHMALRVLDLIEQSVAFRVEHVDATRCETTKAYFRKHTDHGYSFVDCSSFVLMRELRIRQAVTTDSHFREAGFEPLLVTA